MRASTGNEWQKPSKWEHLDLGVGEGCDWDLGNQKGGLPTMKETEVKTLENITPHTLLSYFHMLWHSFLLLPRPRTELLARL